jgi:hypothetical protein
MRRRSYELLFALGAVILITALYVPIARNGAPRAAGLVGHGMGIIGFLMMLSTETLYSLRKRARWHWLGRASYWLQAHIFAGIVGTYLVLLHSAWQLHGLAAIVTLLSVVVVISGFIGRYIYTRIPRSVDGSELPSATAVAARRAMASWHTVHVPLGLAMFTAATLHSLAGLYFGTLGR